MPNKLLDSFLLEVVVCPETHQELKIANQELLNKINSAVEAGRIESRRGKTITKHVEAGLLRSDGKVFYPVEDGIPVLLVDEGIVLPDNL